MDTQIRDDINDIRRVIEEWVIWRDAGDWERFTSVWHDDAYMSATWFQGTANEFIEASKHGFDSGVNILHFLGGSAIDVVGDRAIAQTKMAISQRAALDGIDVDVACMGRFYDFFERRSDVWKIVRRQPIYERDRIDPVDPSADLHLDPELLAKFPVGYRHLAYLQTVNGFHLKEDLPGLTGDIVANLYVEGAAWLIGSGPARSSAVNSGATHALSAHTPIASGPA